MMLGWLSCAASFASLRNIRTKLFLSPRCGRMRFNTTVFSKPSTPIWRARKISAIPPTAMRSSKRYLPYCCSRMCCPRPQKEARSIAFRDGSKVFALLSGTGAGNGRRPDDAVDDKLQEIEQRFERLTPDLGNPEVIGDRTR